MQGLRGWRDGENRRQGAKPVGTFHRATVGILYTEGVPLLFTVQMKCFPQPFDSVAISIFGYGNGRVGKLYTGLGLAFPWRDKHLNTLPILDRARMLLINRRRIGVACRPNLA
jgi:hypothetical protein